MRRRKHQFFLPTADCNKITKRDKQILENINKKSPHALIISHTPVPFFKPLVRQFVKFA